MDSDINGLRREIDKWFELHTDEMLEDLGRLIAIRSVSGPKETGAPFGAAVRECLELASSMLEDYGFLPTLFEDMIITADIGPSPPLLGILTHLDVVDAGGGWDFNPYKMTLRDGRIYGRGVHDNKGPSVAAMYAMRCARDISHGQKYGCRLIFGSGEEIGCEDVELYVSKKELPQYVFSPDSEYPVVNLEKGRIVGVFDEVWDKDITLPRVVSIEGGKTINVAPNSASAVIKGFSLSDAQEYCKEYSEKTEVLITVLPDGDRLRITASGVAAHASIPHKGNNAQTALIAMLAAMPFAQSKGFEHIIALSRLFPHGDYYGRALGIAMSDKISGALTVNFGVLEFSETGFSGNFDSRTSACADEADLQGIIRVAFEREGVALTSLNQIKHHFTPGDSEFVQTLLRVYELYTGQPGECRKMGGHTYVHGIPGGVAFGCAMSGTEYNIHGANEYIGADELVLSAKMFTQVIIEMCG